MRHVLLFTALLCSPTLSRAQTADNKAGADVLFDEGKKLLAAGDIDHACPKFEASLKLADQLGVRLNLADCYEKQGKTASAWAEFREAASRAEKKGDKRAVFAHQREDALAPKLVKLEIDVPANSRVPGLTVRRDGAPVPAEVFDTPFPINPGGYTVDASAAGFKTWSARVDASKAGETVKIEVPRLEAAPEAPKPIEPKPSGALAKPEGGDEEPQVIDRSEARHSRHVLGITVAASGVAAIGTGVVLGLVAKSKWDSASAHCVNDLCDATGVQINKDAKLYGNIGTVVGGVGLAAVAVGAVLYVTAPSARKVVEHASIDAHGVTLTFGF